MRGAKLNSSEQLYKRPFLRLTSVMKEFICLFGIDEEQRRQFYAELKALPQEKVNKITTYYVKGTIAGYKNATWKTNFDAMMIFLKYSLQPLPAVDDDAMYRLIYSTGLLDRAKLQELLDSLFQLDQQFAMLDKVIHVPMTEDNREMLEDTVDVLLSSFIKKADDELALSI